MAGEHPRDGQLAWACRCCSCVAPGGWPRERREFGRRAGPAVRTVQRASGWSGRRRRLLALERRRGQHERECRSACGASSFWSIRPDTSRRTKRWGFPAGGHGHCAWRDAVFGLGQAWLSSVLLSRPCRKKSWAVGFQAEIKLGTRLPCQCLLRNRTETGRCEGGKQPRRESGAGNVLWWEAGAGRRGARGASARGDSGSGSGSDDDDGDRALRARLPRALTLKAPGAASVDALPFTSPSGGTLWDGRAEAAAADDKEQAA